MVSTQKGRINNEIPVISNCCSSSAVEEKKNKKLAVGRTKYSRLTGHSDQFGISAT